MKAALISVPLAWVTISPGMVDTPDIEMSAAAELVPTTIPVAPAATALLALIWNEHVPRST